MQTDMRVRLCTEGVSNPVLFPPQLDQLTGYSLASGILLLNLAVGGDEVERLGLGLDDSVDVAADDNDDVKVIEALVGLLVGNLGTDDDTRVGEHLGLGSSNGNVEGFGGYRGREMLSARP